MKTLRYIVIDAIAGSAAMLLLYLVGTGAWIAAKRLYMIYISNDVSIAGGLALSMMFAGAVVGGIVGFIASRDFRNMMFDPKKVTPEQLNQMESILNNMTFNANTEDVDVEEMKRTLSELGANLPAVGERNKDLQP